MLQKKGQTGSNCQNKKPEITICFMLIKQKRIPPVLSDIPGEEPATM